MLDKLGRLHETKEKTEKGYVHKAEPGGYGRKFDTDEEGDEEKGAKKEAEPKRGRGRPRKDADAAGNVKKYDAGPLAAAMGGKQKKKGDMPKKPTTKHTLKDWFDHYDKKLLAEMMTQQPLPVVGKEGDKTSTQVGFLHVDDQSPAGQALQKAIGTLGQEKKAQIVMPVTQQATGTQQPQQNQQVQQSSTSGGATNAQPQKVTEKWGKPTQVAPEEKGKYKGKTKAELQKAYNALKARGPHKKNSPEFGRMRELAFAIRAKSGWGKVSEQGAEQVDEVAPKGWEGTVKAMKKHKGEIDNPWALAHWMKGKGYKSHKKEDMAEGDIPSVSGVDTMGAGLGAGRSDKTLEEGMNTKLRAAHHAGRAHALAKEGYNCRYDDMEEAKAYHMGFKEGLDECYGQGVYESDVEEGNAFTKGLATTPKGGSFSVGGKEFVDTTSYDAPIGEETTGMIAFEDLDRQLNALLEDKEQVEEGMSISISQGQQGSPDSVSITGTDADVDKLLSFVKQVGLGGEAPEGFSAAADGEGAPMHSHGDINVVDDNEGMMGLIKKLTGIQGGGEDYEDEEGGEEYEVVGAPEEGGEEAGCVDCGSEECQCDSDEDEEDFGDEESDETGEEGEEEQVDEVESEDQMAYEVAETETPEDEEEDAMNSVEDEEQVEESLANAADDTFEADINFMTKAIASGLNKEKQTGQTTVPVIPGQNPRMGSDGVRESTDPLDAWKKLSGL